MSTAQTRAMAQRTDRGTLRDSAVWIIWIAGFLGFVSANDGYSMAMSLTLMTVSAIFLGYRGLPLSRRGDAAGSSSLRRLVRLAGWVTPGPLVAAYFGLMAFRSLTSSYKSHDIVPPLLILGFLMILAERMVAGRRRMVRVCRCPIIGRFLRRALSISSCYS